MTAPAPMNLIRAKQEQNERRHARSQRGEVKRRLADPEWGKTRFHESGHALVDTYYDHHVVRLTCNPDSGGPLAGQCRFSMAGAEPFNLAVSCLAGSIAEYLAGFTAVIQYDTGDMSKALREVSPGRIPAAQKCAIRLLLDHWAAVRAVADALIEYGELSGDDVRRLVHQHSHFEVRTA